MGLTLLTERYAPPITGVLSCWNRILLFGTLPKIWFAEGMTSYLYEHKIRIFDYPRFAEPFRNRLRENAERLAIDNGIPIEFLRKRNVRKEDLVQQILAKRGDPPGLVCILGRWSPARPTNRGTTRTPARPIYCPMTVPDDGKCLHYYFYFIDEELGLGYLGVPTWLPCRLQVYFHGHSWLARVLRKRKIDFHLIDHAFVQIADWERAQQSANGLEVQRLHRRLDDMAQRFCPIYLDFGVAYHWSVDQMRIRHGRGFSKAGGSGGHLQQPYPHRDPHRQARQHRPMQAEHPVRGEKGASASTSASKARAANIPCGRYRSSFTTSSA